MRTLWVALATCALVVLTTATASAQADPDAKGAVTCNASVTAGTTTIDASGNKSAIAGWTAGKVTALAMKKTGRVFTVSAAVKVANWTLSITGLPNAEYQVWAIIEVTDGQTGLQLVGSALTTATVNVANNPNSENVGGSISFNDNQPVRNNGGATISASGKFDVYPGYQLSLDDPTSIAIVTIPSNGGVVRQGYPTSISSTFKTWSNAVCNVPASLTINVYATVPLKGTAQGAVTQVDGTAWVSK